MRPRSVPHSYRPNHVVGADAEGAWVEGRLAVAGELEDVGVAVEVDAAHEVGRALDVDVGPVDVVGETEATVGGAVDPARTPTNRQGKEYRNGFFKIRIN